MGTMNIQNFLCPHCLCSPKSIHMYCTQESCPQYIAPFIQICVHLHQCCPNHCSWNDYINYYKSLFFNYYNSYHIPTIAFYYKYLTNMMDKCQCRQKENVRLENDGRFNRFFNLVCEDECPKCQKARSNVFTQIKQNNVTCQCNETLEKSTKKEKCNIITQTNYESFLQCGDFCEAKESVCYEIVFPKNKKKNYCVRSIQTCNTSTNVSEIEKLVCVKDLSFRRSYKPQNPKYWVKNCQEMLLSSTCSEDKCSIFKEKYSFIRNINSKESKASSIINLYKNKNLCYNANYDLCDCKVSCKCIQTDCIPCKETNSKDLLLQFYIEENQKLRKELNKEASCMKCKDIDNMLKLYKSENNILKKQLEQTKAKLCGLKCVIKETCEAPSTTTDKNIQTIYYSHHLRKYTSNETDNLSITSSSLICYDSKDSLSEIYIDCPKRKCKPKTINSNSVSVDMPENWDSNWSTVNSNTAITDTSVTVSSCSITEHIPKIISCASILDEKALCCCADSKQSSEKSVRFSSDSSSVISSDLADVNLDMKKSCKCGCSSFCDSVSDDDNISTEACGSKFHLCDEITMTSSKSFEILSSVKKKGKGCISFPKTDFAVYIYNENKK